MGRGSARNVGKNSNSKKYLDNMEYDVFISCKSEDYIYAEEIYNFLKENGFNVFLANKELRQMGDSEYRKAISQALKSTII